MDTIKKFLMDIFIIRLLKNPKSTILAIAPVIVGILANKGFNVPLELVTGILSMVYAAILALMKDKVKGIGDIEGMILDLKKDGVCDAAAAEKLQAAVDSIVKAKSA